ncbi:MAG: cupin domain-containing protein [Alphaproteobacteria bacterium]
MATISKISESVDLGNLEKPRERFLLSREKDLQIQLNTYGPGVGNDFHCHVGLSHAYLVVNGAVTMRTMETDTSPVVEYVLTEGDCVMLSPDEYYQIYNHTDAPALMYQVKAPGGHNAPLAKAGA